MFNARKNKAIQAFEKDLELLESPDNHNRYWAKGLAENIRIYIGKDSPLYELASKFDFHGYMGSKKGEPRVKKRSATIS